MTYLIFLCAITGILDLLFGHFFLVSMTREVCFLQHRMHLRISGLKVVIENLNFKELLCFGVCILKICDKNISIAFSCEWIKKLWAFCYCRIFYVLEQTDLVQ